MKPGLSTRRGRPRGNGKRHPTSRNQSVDSNGLDVKVRGTAQQVLDRYLVLARDAYTSGDRVASESYYQYADHYHRLVNDSGQSQDQSHGQGQRHGHGHGHGHGQGQGHGHGHAYVVPHDDDTAPLSPAANPDAPQPDVGEGESGEKDPPDNGAGGEEPFPS
jgi:hypothetical protein